MLGYVGLSQYAASRAAGRSQAYISNALARGSDLQSGTLALLADVCGCDLVIRDRATGEDVAVVDPPARGEG